MNSIYTEPEPGKGNLKVNRGGGKKRENNPKDKQNEIALNITKLSVSKRL